MRLSLTYDDQSEEILGRLDFFERRLYVARTMIPEGYEALFQESARYESVHTSTAIEGNTLSREAAMVVLVEGADPDEPLEVEKVNLNEAYELMASLADDKSTKIDQGIIRTVNSIVLRGLPDAAARSRGKYRAGPSLIVDASTRQLRYRPPPPQWVPELMDYLTVDINQWMSEHPGPIAAALAHFGIISIHPFEDGNGRTARLIADMILNLKGDAADGMISSSKVFHEALPAYYQALREAQGEDFQESLDVTPFVLFHMTALADAAIFLEEQAIIFNRTRDGYRQGLGEVMNERQVNGLMFMTGIGPLSTSRYAKITQSSQATALTDLMALVELGFVTRQGAGKSTRYALSQRLKEGIEKAGGEAHGIERESGSRD